MTPPTYTSHHLQTYLDQHHIEATILRLTEDTPTVPDAARVLGVSVEQIIKSLIFLVDGSPILVMATGTQKVDRRKLAAHFGVGQKRVKFASAEQALEITGYIVGSMPPFGHKTPLPTYLETDRTAADRLYGGGGDLHAMLELTLTTLLEVTKAVRL
jgi:prolyl-tRNA editing enzyme YbaK/EbsC (Cys-tRNA(Pro) deacylase)